MKPLPENFIEQFIQKRMRDRVAHEWRKKPDRLHYRICHKSAELFLNQYKGKRVTFHDHEEVLYLCGTQRCEGVFAEAARYLGSGTGILIVTLDGGKFIAETEYESGFPSEMYGGQS